MKKVLFFLVLYFFLALPVFGSTRQELLTQLETLDRRARVIEAHLKLIEGGGQAIRSKPDLLTDLATIKGDTERVKREIDALPVVPIVDSFSPQEALPGSEVVVRGFGFRTGEGNYAVIRYGNAATEAIAVPVTVTDSATARFSLPTDYALFGTYRTSVFMAGAGESNTRNFQVLQPVAVGGETVRTGVIGVIDAAVTGVTNAVGNFLNSDPTPASPAVVLPSAFIESVEPREVNAGGTLTVRGRNLTLGASYTVLVTDTTTNQTQEFPARNIEGATGVTLEVNLSESLRAGQYNVAIKSSQLGISNTRSVNLLAAVVQNPVTAPRPDAPPPAQTTPPPRQQTPAITGASVQPQGGGALTTGVTGDGGLTGGNSAGVDTTTQDGTPPAGQPPGSPPPTTPPTVNQPPAGTPPAGTQQPSEPPPSGMTVAELLTRVEGILNLIIPFIIGLAVFVILWGIFLYVTKAAEEEKRAEARLYIVWGIVAVFSMLSLWGFVNILVNSFNLQTTVDASKIPKVPEL